MASDIFCETVRCSGVTRSFRPSDWASVAETGMQRKQIHREPRVIAMDRCDKPALELFKESNS
jgi:hypothetical protein